MNPETSVEIPPVQTTTPGFSEKYLNLDFFAGIGMGLLTSLFSFYLLQFFKSKKTKREGMLIGCLVSFVLIIFLCGSFTFYTYYVQKTLKINRRLTQHNQRILKIDNFTHFLAARVLKLTTDKVLSIGDLPEKGSKTSHQKK